ncbi:MAG: hypothetical protein PHW33_01645 [Candidatus Portnoybacteria bacterium]|nr:hypothetical protein [Candidatus Portnoybacteria bacterium]
MKANEVLDHLKDVRSVTAKVVEREPATKIVVTPDMVTMRPGKGKRLLEVGKEGVKDLFQFLHMPPDMVGKIMPGTCGQVANDLLGHKERFELLMKDGKIIGFRAPHAGHSMSPERVLESIEKVVEKPDYHKVAVDGQNVNLEIVGIDKATVTRGDVVRAGALVKFSPLGISNPIVQSFVMRLVCTNGMTSSTVLREYSFGGGRGGDDKKDGLWSWFRKGLKEAYGSYSKVVERYQQMIKDEIPEAERAMMLEAMIKEAGLKDEAAATVRTMAIDTPIRNSYDILNLITYATSHVLEDPKQIHRARRATEVFQDNDSHALFCPVCRKARGQVAALPAPRAEATQAS